MRSSRFSSVLTSASSRITVAGWPPVFRTWASARRVTTATCSRAPCGKAVEVFCDAGAVQRLDLQRLLVELDLALGMNQLQIRRDPRLDRPQPMFARLALGARQSRHRAAARRRPPAAGGRRRISSASISPSSPAIASPSPLPPSARSSASSDNTSSRSAAMVAANALRAPCGAPPALPRRLADRPPRVRAGAARRVRPSPYGPPRPRPAPRRAPSAGRLIRRPASSAAQSLRLGRRDGSPRPRPSPGAAPRPRRRGVPPPRPRPPPAAPCARVSSRSRIAAGGSCPASPSPLRRFGTSLGEPCRQPLGTSRGRVARGDARSMPSGISASRRETSALISASRSRAL